MAEPNSHKFMQLNCQGHYHNNVVVAQRKDYCVSVSEQTEYQHFAVHQKKPSDKLLRAGRKLVARKCVTIHCRMMLARVHLDAG